MLPFTVGGDDKSNLFGFFDIGPALVGREQMMGADADLMIILLSLPGKGEVLRIFHCASAQAGIFHRPGHCPDCGLGVIVASSGQLDPSGWAVQVAVGVAAV